MATQTKHQPLVLVVKAERPFQDNDLDSDAFAGLLRTMHGCNSRFFRHTDHLSDWLAEDKFKLLAPSQVIALIIHEEEYDEDIISEILLLRKEYSSIKNVPTIIIPHHGTSIPLLKTTSFLNGQINKANDLNHEVIDLVGQLVTEWVATRDWLGIDYTERCPEMLDVLEDVYLQNQDDPNYSVPVDQNHMVVAEALRIKLISGELVGKRYDEAFEKKYAESKESDSSSLARDLEKIRGMSGEEKASFFLGMFMTQGTIGGHGPNVDGFAIDAVTLEYLIVGFGGHDSVCSFLIHRLKRMNVMRGHEIYDDENYYWRLFNGLIYKSTPGVETPILKLHWHKEDSVTPQRAADMNRVLDFLKNQKRFIIIGSDHQLL
jgi:hypothetical protein